MEHIKTFLYYVAVLFLIIYVFLLIVSPDKTMEVFGFRSYIVLSNSMEPVINVNDMIISKRIVEEDLEEGDIITFTVYIPDLGADATVTHYIGEITEVGTTKIYHTKGAHAADGIFDKWVDENDDRIYITFDDIQGEYLFKVPAIGYIQDALSNRVFMILLIANGTVIYFLIRYLRRNKEEIIEGTQEEINQENTKDNIK